MSGTAKKYDWHKMADSAAELPFGTNQLCEITVNNKTVCLALHNQAVQACAHKCPHAGGAMADGFVDALGNIVCPLHRYKFSLQNGRNTSGEGYYLKTHPVEVRENGVFIGFEEKKGLFGW
jgi:nitrite reductase/ring-hydroxylating ferredoxin subunit